MKSLSTLLAAFSISLTCLADSPKVEDHSPVGPPPGTGKTGTFEASSPLHAVVESLGADLKAQKTLFAEMNALRDGLALPFGDIQSEEGKKTADQLLKVIDAAAAAQWPSGARNLLLDVLKKDNALSTYALALLLDKMPKEHWTASFHNTLLDLLEFGSNSGLRMLIAQAPLLEDKKFPLRPDSKRWTQVFGDIADGKNGADTRLAERASWALHAAGSRIRKIEPPPAPGSTLEKAQIAVARALDAKLAATMDATDKKFVRNQLVRLERLTQQRPEEAKATLRARLERKSAINDEFGDEIPLD